MKKSPSLLFQMTKLGFIKAIKLVFFVILSTVGYCQDKLHKRMGLKIVF